MNRVCQGPRGSPCQWRRAVVSLVVATATSQFRPLAAADTPPRPAAERADRANDRSSDRGDAEVATERIQLSVGQAHLVRERAVRRIVVGSGRVIQVTALDSG
ncbi:MAG: pilus assembly protein N-terminal domain-containing protein, partial [Burkholderiaceae bacterium]